MLVWMPMLAGKSSGFRSSSGAVAWNGVLFELKTKPEAGFQSCGTLSKGR